MTQEMVNLQSNPKNFSKLKVWKEMATTQPLGVHLDHHYALIASHFMQRDDTSVYGVVPSIELQITKT